MKTTEHNADLCVVGGGLSGMCAAISAARCGLKVVIMQDRPMFGGNASSEIRMWVCGAHGKNNRETGIIEEIALENLYRNPRRTYPIWDTILFEKVKTEKNITALLNCSCNDIEMDGGKIMAVKGWQMTTQTWHKVFAKYFADCSGDSILAPLSGALFKMGREGRCEYKESIAPETADRKTMGLSCLISARQTAEKTSFIPPEWAYKYTKDDLPYRLPDMDRPLENYWYMELGGENDAIYDAEEIRDELLKVAMGIWDFIKNSGECNAENWELDFLGFLPGKRESRRYIGDFVMTQNDVENEGRFDDIIAYGGWTMDDHHPGGINTKEPPTIFHPAPSPFGIPYRCIYSKNIENLFFAGRNISVTHTAMSATRVMATCATLGQAVGTAAYIADKYGLSPRGVYEERIDELKYKLMEEDCYLPFNIFEASDLMKNAAITAGGQAPERLINGRERGDENIVAVPVGSPIEIDFGVVCNISQIRIVTDSDLNRTTTGAPNWLPDKTTICNRPLNPEEVHMPIYMAREIEVWILDETGKWTMLKKITDNRKRLLLLKSVCKARAVRIIPVKTWGDDLAKICSVDIK